MLGSAVAGPVAREAIHRLWSRKLGISSPCFLVPISGIMLKVSKVKTGNSHKFGMVLLEDGNMMVK